MPCEVCLTAHGTLFGKVRGMEALKMWLGWLRETGDGSGAGRRALAGVPDTKGHSLRDHPSSQDDPHR